jgi:hypothetical protein
MQSPLQERALLQVKSRVAVSMCTAVQTFSFVEKVSNMTAKNLQAHCALCYPAEHSKNSDLMIIKLDGVIDV